MALLQNKCYFVNVLMMSVLIMTELVDAEYKCWTPPSQSLLHSNEPHVMAAVKEATAGLRITPIFTEDFLSLPNHAQIKEKIVQYALDFWTRALKPKSPLNGPFRASRGCINQEYELHQDRDGQVYEYCTKGCYPRPTCYTATIPTQYLDKCRVMKQGVPTIVEDVGGPGLPNTDYALMVDASRTSVCSSDVLAYATICQADFALDRPIFGYINFCADHIGLEYPKLLLSRKTAMHEIAHALGFSPMMYAYMRYEDGKPRTPRNNKTGNPDLGRTPSGIYIPSSNTIGYAVRSWISAAGNFSMNRTLLKTPKVVEFASQHFGCQNLDGVELENQGGGGTAAAHFEKRVVLNELMAGSISTDLVVSRLTLSFFADSGWYFVDMSTAQPYLWAQNAGCNFLYESCYQYMKERQSAKLSVWPWCNEIYSTNRSCLTYANAYGTCGLGRRRSSLLPQFQYFDSLPGVSADMLPYYGGFDSLTDYCPYMKPQLEVTDGPSTYCGHPENERYADKLINRELQDYGADSMCFNHDPTEGWKSYQCSLEYHFPKTSASCHRFKCVDGLGLVVILGQKEFNCPLNGGSIQVDTVGTVAYIHGRLICPKCSTVCKSCPSKGPSEVTIPDGIPSKIPCPDTGFVLFQSRSLLLLTSFLSCCLAYF